MEIHTKLRAVLIEYLADCEKNNVDFFIADNLLRHIDHLSETPIKLIAYEANTTLPSVSKFCRKLGYDSYRDMIMDQSRYSDDPDMMKQVFVREYSSYREEAEAYYAMGKQQLLRTMDSMNHEEIRQLAERINNYGNLLILASNYNKNVFSLLTEILMYHGIRVEIVNRHNAVDIYDSLTRKFDLVLVSSLTGKWVQENRLKLLKYADSLYILSMRKEEGFHSIYSSLDTSVLTSYFLSQDYLFSFFLLLNFELMRTRKQKNSMQ